MEKMRVIAKDYEVGVKLTAENNGSQSALAKVAASENPTEDTANKALTGGPPPKKCPPGYNCCRCGCKGYWRSDCPIKKHPL